MHLSKALEHNMSLHVLNLSSNLILDAQTIADGVLANVAAKGGVLEAIDVSDNPMGKEGEKLIRSVTVKVTPTGGGVG